jgi:hypothetical protein
LVLWTIAKTSIDQKYADGTAVMTAAAATLVAMLTGCTRSVRRGHLLFNVARVVARRQRGTPSSGGDSVDVIVARIAPNPAG